MLKIITNADVYDLTNKAASAERLRAHLNIHDSLDARVQRLFIATEPGTYIRPHRHPQEHKWEFLVVLTGEIELLLFQNDGTLKQREMLSPTAVRAIELEPNTWHSYVCHQSGTVVLEIKEGAYIPAAADDFAPWSPEENSDNAMTFLSWMRTALPGEKYS